MLNIIESENRTPFSWQCVGHNPTRWALGRYEDGEMKDIRALVFCLSNGRWGVFSYLTGQDLLRVSQAERRLWTRLRSI